MSSNARRAGLEDARAIDRSCMRYLQQYPSGLGIAASRTGRGRRFCRITSVLSSLGAQRNAIFCTDGQMLVTALYVARYLVVQPADVAWLAGEPEGAVGRRGSGGRLCCMCSM